jgi:hypothetical protein
MKFRKKTIPPITGGSIRESSDINTSGLNNTVVNCNFDRWLADDSKV